MDEVREFQEFLKETLEDALPPEAGVYTFEEEGILAYDAGLVVVLGDDEFQITIVKSK